MRNFQVRLRPKVRHQDYAPENDKPLPQLPFKISHLNVVYIYNQNHGIYLISTKNKENLLKPRILVWITIYTQNDDWFNKWTVFSEISELV